MPNRNRLTVIRLSCADQVPEGESNMKTAGVAELKASLSKYLKHVKDGEEVIITERGKAIARVVPFTRSGPSPAEYEEMVKTGVIIPAKNPGGLPSDFWDRPRPADPDRSMLKALLEEREEGR